MMKKRYFKPDFMDFIWIAGTIGCFLFLVLAYPYHFYHQEQLILCVPGDETSHQGFFSRINEFGNFITQFYYYKCVGPFILTLLLQGIGLLSYCTVSSLLGKLKIPSGIAVIPSLIICCSEFWLACSTNYPLGNTLILFLVVSLLFAFVRTYRGSKIISSCWMVFLAIGLIFQISRLEDKKYEGISLRLEKFYAIDTEAYFGHWEKVERLTQEDLGNYVSSYYHNLAKAKQGKLADGLLDYYQENTRSLLIPVRENESDFSIQAASEAWFQMGDMTLAEHATILGMIFSPHHTGSRAVKRLAEINLIQGETEAAEKYLHILSKSWVHRKWADQHRPGKQTEKVAHFLSMQQSLLPKTDTLRLAGQDRASLLNLLDENPANTLARDYLLCHDLLAKNLPAFGRDYLKYANGLYTPLYAQALLIVKSVEPDLLKECKMPMSNDILQQNQAYVNQFTKCKGKKSEMAAFKHTYWYYYHYEKLEK